MSLDEQSPCPSPTPIVYCVIDISNDGTTYPLLKNQGAELERMGFLITAYFYHATFRASLKVS